MLDYLSISLIAIKTEKRNMIKNKLWFKKEVLWYNNVGEKEVVWRNFFNSYHEARQTVRFSLFA